MRWRKKEIAYTIMEKAIGHKQQRNLKTNPGWGELFGEKKNDSD